MLVEGAVKDVQAYAAYRPKLAWCALEQRIVHRKGQACLAAAVRSDNCTCAQRVVEVRRVDLSALTRRACT